VKHVEVEGEESWVGLGSARRRGGGDMEVRFIGKGSCGLWGGGWGGVACKCAWWYARMRTWMYGEVCQ
jgi:hypothetical protein